MTENIIKYLTLNAKALCTRFLFGIIGMITVWRVTDVYSENIYYLLCLPVLLLVVEFFITDKYTENGEWKWFCPSVFLCIAGVVPGIWLLQMALYMDREDYRQKNGLKECGEVALDQNATALSQIKGVPSVPIQLPADQWAVIIEQFLFFILIIGRWLLPKGQLTRDQLSQLLLVYIGIAADSLEFSLETLKIPQVLCNLPLIIAVLVIWTWSMTQFMLVLTSVAAPKREAVVKTKRIRSFFGGRCCENEVWAIVITMMLQDAPYLTTRLFLIFAYNSISPLVIFFTLKNSLLVILQLYRLVVVCCLTDEGEDTEAEKIEGKAATSSKTDEIELGNIGEAE